MDTLNQSPVASGSQMPVSPNHGGPLSPEPQKTSIGPIVGTIVVILILVAGGLYFWGAQLNRENNETVPYIPSNETVPAAGDSDTQSGLPPQNSSDESAAIQADVEAMNFDQFEAQTQTDVNNFDEEAQ